MKKEFVEKARIRGEELGLRSVYIINFSYP